MRLHKPGIKSPAFARKAFDDCSAGLRAIGVAASKVTNVAELNLPSAERSSAKVRETSEPLVLLWIDILHSSAIGHQDHNRPIGIS